MVQFLGEAHGAGGGGLDSGLEGLFGGPEVNAGFGAGDGGINQLASEEGCSTVGEDDGDMVEAGALRFVDSHGEGGFVFRQKVAGNWVGAALEEGGGLVVAVGVGEDDADIAVEEVGFVVIGGNEDDAVVVEFAAAVGEEAPGTKQRLAPALPFP